VLDDGVHHFWYDSENRMVGSGPTGANAPTTTHSYNYDGICVQTTTNGVTTNYVIDSSLPYASVAEELSSSGNMIARYLYADNLVRMDRSTGEYYYIYDGLGSTRQLTNSSGAVVDTDNYDAFGNIVSSTGSDLDEFLFNGQEEDASTGLIYLRARYMNPEDGRFLSQDSYEGADYEPTTLHRYLYAGDDPADNADQGGNDFGDFDIGDTLDSMSMAEYSEILGTSLASIGFSASGPLFQLLVVTTPTGTYMPVTKVKNSQQAATAQVPVDTPIYIAVPNYVDPQFAVNFWKSHPFLLYPQEFKHYWQAKVHDYKLHNAIYDAFGNFEYGATGRAAGVSQRMLQYEGAHVHAGGVIDPININDINSGFNAIKNFGTLSKKLGPITGSSR
jgi:RHS repeat-associated protein